MHRCLAPVLFSLSCAVCAVSRTAAPASDAFAVSLAQQSLAALTNGLPVADVTLNANVIQIYGSDNESGTGRFRAKGTAESRVDLSLSGGKRTDVRSLVNGFPVGAWSKDNSTPTQYAGHNCWTDAAWFFPALSSLTQTANPSFIFKYIRQEQHGGVSTQHIRVFRVLQQDSGAVFQRLSDTDFFLDATSGVPLAIVAKTHPDKDMSIDISIEMQFANYQPVSGVTVPFHFQQMLNGGVVLDATVTSATINTGLSDALFSLQ